MPVLLSWTGSTPGIWNCFCRKEAWKVVEKGCGLSTSIFGLRTPHMSRMLITSSFVTWNCNFTTSVNCTQHEMYPDSADWNWHSCILNSLRGQNVAWNVREAKTALGNLGKLNLSFLWGFSFCSDLFGDTQKFSSRTVAAVGNLLDRDTKKEKKDYAWRKNIEE